MKNALVNQENGRNYGETDKNGTWEVLLKNGKAEVSYIGGIAVETVEPSEMCEDLEDFENELSQRWDCELAFSGLTQEERETQNQIINAK